MKYIKTKYWQFTFTVGNVYDDDFDFMKYCDLHIALFNHSFSFKIPKIIKPKKESVKYENNGKTGYYTRFIRKEYGLSLVSEAIHLRYGIQPGCWSENDPVNSDHSKVYFWPWNKTIVRHDLLRPDGILYFRNTFPKKENEKHLAWWEVREKMNGEYLNASETVDLKHHDKRTGAIQYARILLQGEEREWRPRCTRWLPIFRHIERTVNCESDIELGARAGEWKGGLMGWSCKWKKEETLKTAFWRWYMNWNGE